MLKLTALLMATACLSAQNADTLRKRYSECITIENLRPLLNQIASDEFEGRESGKKGQKLAANYIAEKFRSHGLVEGAGNGGYFQSFPLDSEIQSKGISENVLGYIEGSDLKEELIIISAHYDHLGTLSGQVFKGADDNGSGTAAVIEMAAAFSMAKKQGHGPRRSLLFIAFSGEEKGLLGSAYYSRHPVFSIKNTVADLNIDMIGRIDQRHRETTDSNAYIYIIGSDKRSADLHKINEDVNAVYCGLNLDYTYNSKDDPNHYYYRSDQYNFVKLGIPVIFYFNGTHTDYHKETDVIGKINFKLLEKRARLVFLTAWELANRTERIKTDLKTEN